MINYSVFGGIFEENFRTEQRRRRAFSAFGFRLNFDFQGEFCTETEAFWRSPCCFSKDFIYFMHIKIKHVTCLPDTLRSIVSVPRSVRLLPQRCG